MSIAPNSSGNHSAVTGSSVHHVVHINPSFLSELEGTVQELPRLLNESAGRDSCCIFRVPRILSENNEKAYKPHMLSIGPFHHGKPQCQMIQEHKGRFLSNHLARAVSKRVLLKDFFMALAPMEEKIRNCYSETLEFNGQDLMWMMVLDGCFIIELFCKVGRIFPAEPDDPLVTMAWILPSLMRDLLRLENQIPYFVLQKLFDLSVGSGNDSPSLAKLALSFFNYMVQRPLDALEKYYDKEGKHLLDLFRMSYVSNCQEEVRRPSRFLHLIPCAKKLDQAGVKLRPRKTHSILDIKFRNGVLEIPVLTIDDFWSLVFLNFFAYEQCYHHSTKYITTYVTFMGCLINTPADAVLLGDHKIVENYFGADEEVARFFNNVGKDAVFDIHRSYLAKVFEEVNEYYQHSWHVRWSEFKHTYFSNPWSFISGVIALVTLVFTIIQFFSMSK
ncbi:hypothetical protein BT93_B1848 [Corymbia citriodora subsp. variegata]|nr:hypothetical protein BT93_B1848 [Corymbia citriodora subsp. variegata]